LQTSSLSKIQGIMDTIEPTSRFQQVLLTFSAITDKITEYKEDLEQLLQAILNLTLSMPHVSYASIMLLDENQTQFHIAANYGDSPFTFELKAVFDIKKLLECSRSFTGQHLLFNKLVDESRWSAFTPEERQRLNKLICSSLRVGQTVIGVACVYGEHFGHELLESEEIALWTKLASLAIEKSRLYNQIHKKLAITREELKRSQSQVIRSEKLNSLAEMAMGIAHTIRNPITVIGGLCRRMYREFAQDDPNRVRAEMILSEVLRLEGVINEFERFSAIDQISFRHEDINRIVDEASDAFLSQRQADSEPRLKRSLFNVPLICKVDPDLIIRCITHLFSNACEASGNSAPITVSTSRIENDAIIDIVDLGKGMSREEMAHAFDPFYSTKAYSAGMGLTFVHFVITEHSGRVELKSQKGTGTRLRIRLPLDVVS